MQPYEKFKMLGAGALSEEELLAIMIRTGTSKQDSLEIATSLLKQLKTKSLLGLFLTSYKDLVKISGIGEVKAIQLLCISELARRMSRSYARQKLCFKDAKSVADYYMEEMRHLEKEQVRLIYLDNRLQYLDESVLSIGTINRSLVSPREVFSSVMRAGAFQFIMLHNHPSGDSEPSNADIEITGKLLKGCSLLEISLTDHIIIGDQNYYSMKENKII